MSEHLNLNPKSTAILIMDYQNGIAAYAPNTTQLFERASHVINAARNSGMKVIYIVIGFRPGYPEVSPRHPLFSQISATGRFVNGSQDQKIHEAVAPQEGDLVITKHRVSAFSGNDLEMILRSQGIDTLVLFGISTSGVVLSTLTAASDQDYRCVVLKDCCGDSDEEVHRVLTEKVYPRRATVVDAATFLREIGR